MAKTRPTPIRLPDDPELYRLLAQLNVKVTETPDHQGKMVTEAACRKARVPFELFQAFARLTKSPTQIISRQFELPKNQSRLIGSFLRLLKPDNKVGLEGGLSQTQAAPEPFDSVLDNYESARFRELLIGLDRVNPLGRRDRLDDPRGVKTRLTAIAADPCWLEPTSIEKGLLGAVTGDLRYQYNTVNKKVDLPTEFSCHYLPELTGQQGGLFFLPQNMPAPVREAARSVVRIERFTSDTFRSIGYPGKWGGGSGVIVDDQYVLTVVHLRSPVMKTTVRDGRSFYHLTMTAGGEVKDVLAEGVDVPAEGDVSPDLLLLHVPTLPADVRPVPFAEDFRPVSTEIREEPLSADPLAQSYLPFLGGLLETELSLSTVSRTYRIYPARQVFAIGVPNQKPPIDLLVTEGVVDHRHSGPIGKRDKVLTDADDHGWVHMTSIVLPGDSGGAVVDEQGRLIGIIVAVTFQPGDEVSPGGGIKKRIDGSFMHSVDQWGPAIRKAIRDHRLGTKSK